MHSAQAQSVRVKEKISFVFVGHYCRDMTRMRISVGYILSLFPGQVPTFWAIGQYTGR